MKLSSAGCGLKIEGRNRAAAACVVSKKSFGSRFSRNRGRHELRPSGACSATIIDIIRSGLLERLWKIRPRRSSHGPTAGEFSANIRTKLAVSAQYPDDHPCNLRCSPTASENLARSGVSGGQQRGAQVGLDAVSVWRRPYVGRDWFEGCRRPAADSATSKASPPLRECSMAATR